MSVNTGDSVELSFGNRNAIGHEFSEILKTYTYLHVKYLLFLSYVNEP
jgi:hypothetical protein